MDFPQRKANRITNYDYSQNGAYFVTICTQNRAKILSEIVGADARIVLTSFGQIAEKYIRSAPEVEKYVIMPDHIHLIIGLNDQNKKISGIVRSIKTLITKEIGVPVFQRSYYDHVIRNQQDYNEIWEYIENNPGKWAMTRPEQE